MRMEIRENLKTANLNTKFTGFYKKRPFVEIVENLTGSLTTILQI